MSRFIILSGPIGSGKTTAVRRAVELLGPQGVACAGIAGVPVLDEAGQRLGIDALDLSTGRRRRLARFVGAGGQVCPAYEFDRRAFSWARGVLRRAIDAGAPLLVLDEIGPLELRHGRGYAPALERVLSGAVPLALLVVREPLLPRLLERLFGHQFETIHLTLEDRDSAPERIARAVLTVPRCSPDT